MEKENSAGRVIKFRAWNPDQKAMHSSEDAGVDWLFGLVKRHGATVMQFTGLKDKHGKEIYEGDILGGGSCPEVVKFRDGAFLAESGGDAFFCMNNGYFTKESEVIGNIYQNPELLK